MVQLAFFLSSFSHGGEELGVASFQVLQITGEKLNNLAKHPSQGGKKRLFLTLFVHAHKKWGFARILAEENDIVLPDFCKRDSWLN